MRRPFALLLLGAAVSSLNTAGHAVQPAASREDELKAAYLFNFAKFVEWPQGRQASALVICVVDAGGVTSALAAAISNKRIGARTLGVRSLSPTDPRDDCDLLYVSAAAIRQDGLAANPPDAPTLTVSDAADFAKQGGMIEMFSEGNRIRFNINTGNAHRAGLRISSNLLRLATKVE